MSTAPELAALARQDPSRPTFDECYRLLYGPGGLFGVKRSGVTVSPWVVAFADRYGRERLRMLEVNHDVHGDLIRKGLRQSYEQFLEATEGREVASIAGRRQDGLARLDPLTSLGVKAPAEIGSGGRS